MGIGRLVVGCGCGMIRMTKGLNISKLLLTVLLPVVPLCTVIGNAVLGVSCRLHLVVTFNLTEDL